MAGNQKKYKPNTADIIYENFEDEVVLINLKTGIYYSLNFSGKQIWECVEKNATLDEIGDLFLNHYRIKTEKQKTEIKNFVMQLEAENLVVAGDSSSDQKRINLEIVVDRNAEKGESFDSPILKKYTDQQELLLLDPIHEVTDLGWPDKGDKKPDSK